ncbi:hypothetical protein FRB96_002877 [Tulasnella sp. 330]|nr:hypothetical protein FRB96_002877 [Tulasnella sp. 330]KAG8884967.1 hypothetical protein FRB97_002795 [Tulasnella sp. 331]
MSTHSNSLPDEYPNSSTPPLPCNGHFPSTPSYYSDEPGPIASEGNPNTAISSGTSPPHRRFADSPTPQSTPQPSGSRDISYNIPPVQLETPQIVKTHHNGIEDGADARGDPVDEDVLMEDITNAHAASSSAKPPVAPRGRVNQNNHFPGKLVMLLNDETKDSIAWTKDGKGFVIPDSDAFVEQVLKAEDTPFKTRDFGSFVRVANSYGFSKVRAAKASKRCEFLHISRKFRQGRPADLKYITRKALAVHPNQGDAINAESHSPKTGAQSPTPVVVTAPLEAMIAGLQKQINELCIQQKREVDDLRAQLKQELEDHQRTKDSLRDLWTAFQNGEGLMQRHCYEVRYGSSGNHQNETPKPAATSNTAAGQFRQAADPIGGGSHHAPAGMTVSVQLSTSQPLRSTSDTRLPELTAQYPTNVQRPNSAFSRHPAPTEYTGFSDFDLINPTAWLENWGLIFPQPQPAQFDGDPGGSEHAPQVANPARYSATEPSTMHRETSPHPSVGSRNCGPAEVPRRERDFPNGGGWL